MGAEVHNRPRVGTMILQTRRLPLTAALLSIAIAVPFAAVVTDAHHVHKPGFNHFRGVLLANQSVEHWHGDLIVNCPSPVLGPVSLHLSHNSSGLIEPLPPPVSARVRLNITTGGGEPVWSDDRPGNYKLALAGYDACDYGIVLNVTAIANIPPAGIRYDLYVHCIGVREAGLGACQKLQAY